MTSPLCVLMVEDSEDDALLILRELRRGGFEVVTERVDTAKATQAALANRQWDIVIADYSMPGFNGVAALELVKAHELDLPFIIVSGTIGEDVAVAAMRAGAHDYLMKGNLTRLVPAVERELRDAEVRRTRRQVEIVNAKLSRAITQSPSIVIITDPNGNIEYVNPRFLQATGYSFQEIAGQSTRLLNSGMNPPELYVDLWQTIICGGEWRGELCNRKKNGELFWVSAAISGIRNEEGQITHFVAVQEDITERRWAEQALRDSERRFRELTDLLPQTVFEVDSRGIITFANQYGLETFGYTRDELEQGLNALQMVIPNQRERLLESIQRNLHSEKTSNSEYTALRKDGHTFPVVIYCNANFHEGTPVGLRGIVVDLSDRKQAEEHRVALAVEKERVEMLRRFIADVSHDFKTPLTTMSSSIYLLSRKLSASPDFEKYKRHLDALESQTHHLAQMIEDMLRMSRLDAMAELALEPLDLNTLVQEIVAEQEGVAAQREQELKMIPALGVLGIQGDREQLYRAISNLIENAVHYTPSGGVITVCTAQQGQDVVCEVSDTGVGIAPEDLPHVFERFFRGGHARNSSQGGTGLGLAIAQRIVHMHHGDIQVGSVAGEGSVFRITLPGSP